MSKKIVVTSAIAIVLAIWLLWPNAVTNTNTEVTISEIEHRRETWISALEWCESRGKNSALNPEDRDGTPSYSNFQWKPSTFLYFGKQYGLIATSTSLAEVPELLKNYELQRDIVRHMVPDKTVNWYNQFPDCVKTKVGLPPVL